MKAPSGRPDRRPRPRRPLRAALAGALLALGSCSPIMVEEEDPPDRRVYVNDHAANDSLDRAIAREGVKFVLQPGKPYVLGVATARTTDVLEVNLLQAGGQKAYMKIPAVHDGTRELFSITSNHSSASFFTARLLPGGNPLLDGSIQDVVLQSMAAVAADTLRIKLLFVQSLANLPSQASKQAFANEFFARMNTLFNQYAIVVAGIIEVVDPELGPLNFPFTDNFVGLRGSRAPNHAHMYLVDSITVGDASTGPVGTVLGFSAREVVDISEHRESRVILANRAAPARLAITAAHELCHFFGMRHSVSTEHDMRQDLDYSNVEDGFSDTRTCNLGLGKSGAGAHPAAPLPGGEDGPDGGPAGPYCLRIASNACTEISCDLRNLMHPVECENLNQTVLSGEQVLFLKRNMSLYRR